MKADNGFKFFRKFICIVCIVTLGTYAVISKIISLHHHFNQTQTVVVAKYIFNARSKIKYISF